MFTRPFLRTESNAPLRAAWARGRHAQASAPRPWVWPFSIPPRSSVAGSIVTNAPAASRGARRAGSGSETNTRAPMQRATCRCICPIGPAPTTSRSSDSRRPTFFSDLMQQASGSENAASRNERVSPICVGLRGAHRDVLRESAEHPLGPLQPVLAHVRLAGAAVVALPAAQDEVQRHPRAGLEIGHHVRADLDDLARGLVAEDDRVVDDHGAAVQPLLERADAAVLQLHQELVAADRGHGQFLDPDLLRCGEHGSFHEVLPNLGTIIGPRWQRFAPPRYHGP